MAGAAKVHVTSTVSDDTDDFFSTFFSAGAAAAAAAAGLGAAADAAGTGELSGVAPSFGTFWPTPASACSFLIKSTIKALQGNDASASGGGSMTICRGIMEAREGQRVKMFT